MPSKFLSPSLYSKSYLVSLALLILQSSEMWHTYSLIFFAVLTAHGTNAHQSFRILGMTRGFDVNDTSPEVLGGTSHDCYRTCVAGDTRTCKYSFTVVEYTTMSRLCGNCPYTIEDCYNTGCITAGGHIRKTILANHMLPGPAILVCEGDIVQVDVINTLPSGSTTIHWHGMYQYNTGYMDGTPFLTQCPIHPHNSFQYKFTAEPSGSHVWHSHSGFEEADGLYGAFIVRKPDDPLSQYYDYDLPEHIMAIWHWYPSSTASVLNAAHHRSESARGYSLTINGLGATVEFERDGVIYNTPRAEFTVTQGSRYRFRLMYNAAIYCPVQISVDDHILLLISAESGSVEPVAVDSLIINGGERYDVVITANQNVGNYWIRYRGIGNCLNLAENVTVSGEAILRYTGANISDPSGSIEYDDAYRSGVLFNPVHLANDAYENNTLIRLVDLTSTLTNQPNISGTPDHIIYMQYAYHTYNEFHSPGPYPQINQISFEFPPISLLTQSDEITSDMYCTEEDDSAKDCVGNYCTCPYIYKVKTGSLVEMVVVDMGVDRFTDHPMHLHGYHYQVVAMESVGETITLEDVKSRNEAGLINKKLVGAPVKDNVGVPAQGFAVLRFIANNPGYWFFHCHVSRHTEHGMGVVLKVGEHEEMAQPPDSFPRCGNWDLTKTSTSSSSSSSYFVAFASNGSHRILVLCLVIFAMKSATPFALIFRNS